MSQALANGLLTGGLYAAFAIGLSLIYGVSRVISAVHGAFIALGAYLAQTAWSAWRIDPFAMLPVLLGVGFVLGYAVQRLFVNPVIKRNVLMTVALTFGLDLVITAFILLVWGAQLRTISVAYAGVGFDVLGARVPVVRLMIFLLAVALALALDVILHKTTIGAQIRAVAQDRPAAELMGIDPEHTYGVAHGLGAAVACAAGGMVAMLQPLQPFMATNLLVLAFAVVVLAGFGSIAPVILAGVLLASAEQLVGVYLGTEFQRLAIFALYLIVATVRPRGLFGARFYAH